MKEPESAETISGAQGPGGSGSGAEPETSIILPVYNEQDNLGLLLDEIAGVMSAFGRSYEILCVDDCSRDRSVEVLRGLKSKHPTLRILRHRRNLGESAASTSGMAAARGKLLVTIDADGQNDPHDIPRMIETLEKGPFDCVCGVRRKRMDSARKRVASRLANRVRAWATGDNIHDAGCTFRVLHRRVLGTFPIFRGVHRFIPTLLRLNGFRVKEVPINDRPRTRGKSKYGNLDRLIESSQDLLAMHWYRRRHLPLDRVAGEE